MLDALDVDRPLEQPELAQHLADLPEMPAELEDRRGLDLAEPGAQLLRRQGRGQDDEALGARHQRLLAAAAAAMNETTPGTISVA